MRANRGKKKCLDIWLAASAFAALIGVRATDATAVSIFAVCPGVESHAIFEIPKEIGLSIAELSATGSELSRSVMERGMREPLSCGVEGGTGSSNLFLDGTREAARIIPYARLTWRVTLAADERALLGEPTQGKRTESPTPTSLQGLRK